MVRRVESKRVWVECDDGIVPALLRGLLKGGPRRSAHVVAVGDRVRLVLSDRDGATIEEVLPRRNRISRADPGDRHRELVVAANVDRIVVIVSVDKPRLNLRGLDRLLILGESSGLSNLIVLNKMDLMPKAEPSRSGGAGQADDDPPLPSELECYSELGYRVLPASARTGRGCEEVRLALGGRISVLLGPSGAGKSSLLNRFFPELDLRTQPISRATSKGVHTTTRVEWIPLPEGGAVLDSPGIRSIEPWGLTPGRLASCFPEFRDLPPCQFGDCLHREEPVCQVRSAVAKGHIRESRHQSYLRVLASLIEGDSWNGLSPKNGRMTDEV
jgi:ribosome biogenesis GTPase / thiamine phosphate phosphatase